MANRLTTAAVLLLLVAILIAIVAPQVDTRSRLDRAVDDASRAIQQMEELR